MGVVRKQDSISEMGNMELANWRLSPDFTLWEMIQSKSYPQFVEFPPAIVILYLEGFCRTILQPIRDALGVVKVDSGWRNKTLNAKVGGCDNSVHQINVGSVIIGVAADIVVQDEAKARRFLANCDIPFTTCIWYPKRHFFHIDTRPRNSKALMISVTPGVYHQMLREEFEVDQE